MANMSEPEALKFKLPEHSQCNITEDAMKMNNGKLSSGFFQHSTPTTSFIIRKSLYNTIQCI